MFFRYRSDFILIPFEYQDKERHFELLNNYKNLFQVSIGPTIHSTGIKACLTYNPPGPNYPGYQRDRTVSKLILVKDNINMRVCQGYRVCAHFRWLSPWRVKWAQVGNGLFSSMIVATWSTMQLGVSEAHTPSQISRTALKGAPIYDVRAGWGGVLLHLSY